MRCCGARTTAPGGRWWCPSCGIYLVLDVDSGEWVSHAEREHRQRMVHNRRVVAVSARLAATHLIEVRGLLPAGWSAATSQAISGARHTIAVTPPVGAVDVSAYLSPPACDGEGGWTVRVHNRTQGVGFPLYTAGGAHAATYPTAPDAAAAAVTALRCEIAR